MPTLLTAVINPKAAYLANWRINNI